MIFQSFAAPLHDKLSDLAASVVLLIDPRHEMIDCIYVTP